MELQPQSQPKAEEHPQAYQPTTQPWAPSRPAAQYSTRDTDSRGLLKVKWTNPRNEGEKTRKWGERNATLLERHAKPR